MQRPGLTAVSPKEPPANTLLLLFFTGHGVSIGGENYLMTHLAGENLENLEAMRRVLLPVADLTRAIDRIAAASILILDTHFPPLDQPKMTR